MRRGIQAMAVAATGGADRASPALRWRGVVPAREPETAPWGLDEPGVSPRVAGLACGAAVLAVALAGFFVA